MRAMRLDFVIPVCNERDTLETLADGIAAHAADRDFRILFIDDGSTDGSAEVLEALAERAYIDCITFRDNFGKTNALAAAFQHTTAEVVITMDADLQDDPKEIPRLLDKLDQGFGMVCGWKARRHDPWHKTLPSRVYNAALRAAFGHTLHDINTGFKAIEGDLARRLPLYDGTHRLLPVFAERLGYSVTEIPVEHHARRYGHSKYGFGRFFVGARDAFALWLRLRRAAAVPPVTGADVVEDFIARKQIGNGNPE